MRHPLDWIEAAQARGYRVLLDAAAFVPTSRLSLAATPADFVALSFYKMFGYPTGVGALIARRDALARLRRRYFGGGTVQFVSVQNRLARLHDGAAAFEDGTPSFLAMPAIVRRPALVRARRRRADRRARAALHRVASRPAAGARRSRRSSTARAT